MKQKLTPEQVRAIVVYANQHGRTWKSQLNDAWMTGVYSNKDPVPELQNLRNNFGPSWLVRLNLIAVQELYRLHQNY